MAPRGAVRSTSRRDTPVSPPKIAASVASPNQPGGRRSTRSQSRGISVATNDQPPLLSRIAKQDDGEKATEPGLDTVPEFVEVDYPELNPNDGPDGGFRGNGHGVDASSGADSGITSYTQYELSKLDPESMANALPFLYQYSDLLLNFFSSRDVTQLEQLQRDLQKPASRPSKKLNTLLEGFVVNRKHYGDATAIDLDVAVRAMVGQRSAGEIPDEPWRPDAVLYMANLAQYVSSVFSSSDESEPAKEILASMFNSFPALFGPVFDAHAIHHHYYSSDLLLNNTLLLVLDVRTQYLLQQLSQAEDHPAHRPDQTLRAVFYVQQDLLRGPDYTDELSTLPATFQAVFHKRIAEIRQHFSSGIGHSVDLDGLRKAFPYTGFSVRLAQWAQLMAKQHGEVITALGGMHQIQSELQDEFERRQSGEGDTGGARSQSTLAERPGELQQHGEGTDITNAAKARRSSNPVSVPTPKKLSEIQALEPLSTRLQPRKSLEWRAKQQQIYNEMLVASRARKAAKAAREAPASRPLRTDAPAFDVNQGGEEGPTLPFPATIEDMPPPSQYVFTVLETLRRHEEQSNKENIDTSGKRKRAFIDKQPGAQKISFDSQDETLALPDKSSAKRKAPEADDEGEDDDFEVDPRSAHRVPRRPAQAQPQRKGKSLRRSKTITAERVSHGSPSKRARVERTHTNEINDEDDREIVEEEEEEEEEEEDEEEVEEEKEDDDDDDDDDDNLAATSQLRGEEADMRRHRSVSSKHPNQRLPLHKHQNIPSSPALVRGSSAVPPLGTQIAAINQQARQKTALRLAKFKQPQQRSRWTEEEVERLVELIESNGVSWSNLLRLDLASEGGGKLQQRDQVSLKDKARNMKMDLLKAGAELPKNFEHIKLGSRLIGILEAQGIRYNDH